MSKYRPIPAIGTSALALVTVLCLSTQVRAAERITLTNGFDLTCNRHQLIDGKIRIYLKASEPDYFELKPDAIATYETVPDPAPATPSVETAPATQTFGMAASPSFATGHDRQVWVSTHTKRAEKADEVDGASALKGTFHPNTERLTPNDLHQLLAEPSAQHNVDEDLLVSLVKAESGGYTHAVSRTGARGLMQLMPGTARQLGVADSFAPDQNVQGGTAYFDTLLNRYHDNIALALAAYNAGPGAVDRYRGIPPYRETQAYVARVIHEFNRRVLARRSAASAHPALAGSQAANIETNTGENAGTGRD